MAATPETTANPATSSTRALSITAFATLLLIACIMGANHVAARIAFNHGTDVATAVVFRSVVTTAVMVVLLLVQRVPLTLTPRKRNALALIGLLVGLQSLFLYSAVARLPVALALLAFNSYPLWGALWARVLYRDPPAKTLLQAMPVILVGLVLALDVFGAASGLGASAHWSEIGAGVAFAIAGAAVFGIVLALTQHETVGVDGRVRTAATMGMAGIVALLTVAAQGGFHLPTAPAGWMGLSLLTLLYGTGITMLFTVLPRLGVVGNSAILNVEPVAALVMGWAILGQAIAPVQVVGALIVVAAVMALGLRKR